MRERRAAPDDDVFRRTHQKARTWLADFGEVLGQTRERLAYRGLGAALHAVRDVLPISEAVALAAQLPMLIRGLYYEGWQPAHVPRETHTLDELDERIAAELDGGLAASPRQILRAGLTVLARHVDPHEIARLRRVVPKSVRDAWPDPVLAPAT